MPETVVGGSIDEASTREVDFRQEVRRRLHDEHPDLIERWLPRIDDPDPHGRLLGYPALQACMDVRDTRKKVELARKLVEELNPVRWSGQTT